MNEHEKILIVDDREENLLALEKTLCETDAKIVRAASGNAALAASLHHDFALAILDVQMPGMDGYELAGLFRGDENTRHVPIIFLTAALQEERDVFRGYESGAVDYILKPYDPAILRGKVQVFLELARQRAELARQRVLLVAANKELEAFAYSVSHDLRAPLRAIDGFSQALLEDSGDKLDRQGLDHLRRIRAAAQRMGVLIDALLNLSRVARKKLERQPVDMTALAREVTSELSEREPERDVELVIRDGLVADGDPALLRVALENLLGNAWKFTRTNDRARIEIGAVDTEDGQVCFVRDDGVGFDMEYAGKLFGAFQRLHSTADFEGTGIGLATVQRIIHRHGGRVWAEGEVGQGATFYFTL